jgi:hypothetical protein
MTKRRAESGGEIPTVFWVPTENGSNIVGRANEYHANTVKDTKGTHSMRDGCTNYAHFLEVSNDGLVERAL